MDKKLNVDIYCLCWNEIQLLPHVVKYWELIARHVYVFDNYSDDGSVEFLSKFDWITVQQFKSDGINELIYLQIKDNCWKNSDADWVIVCDLDECIYSEHFFDELLSINNIYTIVNPQWVECLNSNGVPKQSDKLLHKIIDGCYINSDSTENKSKMLMFKPSEITNINYTVGAHSCSPTGNVKIYKGFNILHFKQLGIEYTLNRHKSYLNRLSQINKQYNWGCHYNTTLEEYTKKISEKYKNILQIDKILI